MKSKKNFVGGFTLVELMVVVAIIGILAVVAIPNFKKYQAKAKTSEAKLQLSSLYMAQTSFLTDYDTFAVCLDYMGFNPAAEVTNRYYVVGMGNEVSSAAMVLTYNNGGAPTAQCPLGVASGNSFFPAGKRVGATAAMTVYLAAANALSDITPTTFTAVAEGVIDDGHRANGTTDIWTITEGKTMQHDSTGY